MKPTLFALAALLTSSLATSGDHWVADYDEAVQLAKKQGKHLFVDFTGSDWCGWCIRLHKEVFDHDEFLTPMNKDYILVSLDFPNSEEVKAKVPNPVRNAALAQMHAVAGYPTVLLMTADGLVYGRTGYQAGGPEGYVKHVNELRTKGMAALKAVTDSLDAFEKAEGEARIKALTAILNLLEKEGGDSAFAGSLAAPIKANWKSLPVKDQAKAIDLLNTVGQADKGTLEGAKVLDPKNESGLYARSVLAFMEGVMEEAAIVPALAHLDALVEAAASIDVGTAESLYLLGTYWNSEFAKNPERAKHYAAKGLEVTTEPRYKAFFQETLDKK
ncbi:MAG: thioredoxin family protein [Planctomycetota bacterium]|jgi:thioredoxin-related protein|nr:thioredoxin family protein [Planctomycetota bacterium]MDP6939018.1 thioredoxin family protein [Planctomycetota bacterium]